MSGRSKPTSIDGLLPDEWFIWPGGECGMVQIFMMGDARREWPEVVAAVVTAAKATTTVDALATALTEGLPGFDIEVIASKDPLDPLAQQASVFVRPREIGEGRVPG